MAVFRQEHRMLGRKKAERAINHGDHEIMRARLENPLSAKA
jgi:hypothetical protein